MRALLIGLLAGAPLVEGCSEDGGLAIGELFTIDGPGQIAPPAVGPDDRLVLATREAPGRVATFDLITGVAVDPPFDAFATSVAPVTVGGQIVVVTPGGRIAFYELNGTQTALVPATPLGLTGPMAAGPADTLRVATTSGRLVSLDTDGEIVFEVDLDGAGVGAPAVSADGSSFVATDAGTVLGFDAAGNELFRAAVTPPVSPPALLSSGVVAVVAADGIRGFGRDGSAELSSTETGFAGLVAAATGGLVAWSNDGRMVRLDASGSVLFSVTIGGGASTAPLPLPEDRFGWVSADGVARTMDGDGTIIAEREIPSAPTAELLAGERSRAYVPLGNRLIAIDFVVPL